MSAYPKGKAEIVIEMAEIETYISEKCNKFLDKTQIHEIKIVLSDTKIAVFRKINEKDYIFTHTKTVPEIYQP